MSTPAPFIPALATPRQLSALRGGFLSGDGIHVGKLADQTLKTLLSGPWLACYMLRRFGWPNIGSDDFKELCSWALTTPTPGLYLTVTPYMGQDQSRALSPEKNGSIHTPNLHFGLAYNEAIGRALNYDVGRAAYITRLNKLVLEWWRGPGRRHYVLLETAPDSEEARLHLVHVFATDPETNQITGLFHRQPHHTDPQSRLHADWVAAILAWLFSLRFPHRQEPEKIPWPKDFPGLPSMTEDEREAVGPPRAQEFKASLAAALQDLLRPTYVRDVHFNPIGRAVPATDTVRYFKDAGYAPSYLYGPKPKRPRAKNPG